MEEALTVKYDMVLVLILLIMVLTTVLQGVTALAHDVGNRDASIETIRYLVERRITSSDEMKSMMMDIIYRILDKLNISIHIKELKGGSPEKKCICECELAREPYKYFTAPTHHVAVFIKMDAKNETIDKIIYSKTLVGKDILFWKLYSLGYWGYTYVKPLEYLNYRLGITGRCLYNQLNISGYCSVDMSWEDPNNHLWIDIHLRNFYEVYHKLGGNVISRAIAYAILEWYYDNVLSKVFNKSILSLVRVFPNHVSTGNVKTINLMKLEPPLPTIPLVFRLSNGSILIIKATVNDPAHLLVSSDRCLVKYKLLSSSIVNSPNFNLTEYVRINKGFKCILHLTVKGLKHYLATGRWSPWEMLNKTEYSRYLRLLSQLNTTNVSIEVNDSTIEYVYGNTTLIVGPFFYIYVEPRGGVLINPISRSPIDIYVFAMLPIIVGYSDVVVHRDDGRLVDYLVKNCGVARLLVDRYGGISIMGPYEKYMSYLGFSIDALGEALNITSTLYEKYYWDNVSRRLLDIVTNATLANSFSESSKLYKLLSSWGRMLLRRVLGRSDVNTSNYFILLPVYTVGEAYEYTWEKAFIAASYIAGKPVILACSNLTDLAVQLKEFVRGLMGTSNTTYSTPTLGQGGSCACTPTSNCKATSYTVTVPSSTSTQVTVNRSSTTSRAITSSLAEEVNGTKSMFATTVTVSSTSSSTSAPRTLHGIFSTSVINTSSQANNMVLEASVGVVLLAVLMAVLALLAMVVTRFRRR